MSARASYRIRVFGLALLTALSACDRPESQAKQSQSGNTAVNVVTAIAARRPLATVIEAVGTAQAKESVDVTTKASNIVTAIHFTDGDLVHRGDVLIELDSAEARATQAEAEAGLAESEGQYRRSRDLFAQQALSQSQLDQIEATLKANRARVNASNARLADTVIRAGFDGRTGFRRVSIGGLVSPGTVITTLDDTSTIKLDFTVPETFFYLLRNGLPIKATSAGLPNREFEGKVTNVDSRVDATTRSVTVRAEVPNRDGVLRPGMFMTVNLQGDSVPTLLVPEAAIIPEQGRTFVFVVVDGKAARREVRIGRRRPGEVEITRGLQESEHVVIEGTQNVREGMAVSEEVRETTPAVSS